ncbi:alpha/beta fold hydrolase [Thiorhodospira sibirica]|uniref:alpha/beta fold hydrolase n=1 Tax=Thiorhodospira sibirica TaxID=154347 RepID=UPI00022C050A|nr:alpha/beta hydrolase [Thiorhodospira sibirica]
MTSHADRFITLGDDLRMHYRYRPGADQPVVVFLHGSFLSSRSWAEVMPQVLPEATLIAPDRPAFGLTSRPLPMQGEASVYGPDAQSDLIVRLLDQLGHPQAVLVGNSTGGSLALYTALRYPQRVQGLVLVGAMAYSGYATAQFPRWLPPFLRRIEPLGVAMMRFMIQRLFAKTLKSFWADPTLVSAERLEAYRQDFQQGPWDHAWWELFLASHPLHLAERLAQITQPCLVLSGEHDRTVKVEESVRLAEDLPQARLVILKDCAHLPQEEVPLRFAEALNTFLQQLKPAV